MSLSIIIETEQKKYDIIKSLLAFFLFHSFIPLVFFFQKIQCNYMSIIIYYDLWYNKESFFIFFIRLFSYFLFFHFWWLFRSCASKTLLLFFRSNFSYISFSCFNWITCGDSFFFCLFIHYDVPYIVMRVMMFFLRFDFNKINLLEKQSFLFSKRFSFGINQTPISFSIHFLFLELIYFVLHHSFFSTIQSQWK